MLKRHWPAILSLGFLVALPFVLYWPALVQGRMIYGFDVITLGVPFRREIFRCLDAHQWPLWMPDLFSGIPGIAACNLQFTFPTDFIGGLCRLSDGAQLGVDAITALALSGMGMFLFLRRLGRSVAASLLGAFFFAVSGSQITQLFGGYVNFTEGIALTPWAFWAAHKARSEDSLFAWGLCGLVFALQILAVAIQLFAYVLPAVALFALSLPAPETGPTGNRGALGGLRAAWANTAFGLALALGLAFFLSAPQLWMTLQYLHLAGQRTYTQAGFIDGSIGLHEALTWLAPGRFGWQTPGYHGAMGDCFTSEYFGILPWTLAAGALLSQWRREKMVRWMAGMAVVAFFFAQRRWTPFYPLLHRLPVYSGFRIWSRILFLLTFAVCTLAAYGWDALAVPVSRRAALAGGIIFSLIAWCALGFDWGPAGADAGTLVSAMVLIPLALGLAWLRSRGILPGLMLGLVLVFQAQDQGQVYTRFVRFMQPWEALPKTNDTVQVPPPPQAGEDPWRIYEKDDSFPNAELLKGYENMEGRESMPLDSFLRIKGAFGQRWWDWANLYGIRYVVFHSMAGSSDPGDTIRIMHNPRAFPRAWLVGRIRSVAGDEDAYRLLSDPGFDPRLSVALAGNHGTMNGPPPAGSVRWVSRSPQSSAMDVTSDRDAVLLVSNAWYPSWTAQVDGQGSPVLKADGGLQAIILPSGSHHVVLRFDPSLFNAALLAAMFACIVLAGLAYGERWRRPAGSGSAAPPLS